MNKTDLYKIVKNDMREGILVTLIEGKNDGEKVLITDGKIITSNDIKPSDKLIQTALHTEKSGIVNVDGQQVFQEIIENKKHMVICGAGHVSMPIIELAKKTGFFVTVIEDRPFFANNAAEKGADEVICDSFENALAKIEGDSGTYFVIVTRGHRFDCECLTSILKKERAYVGMMSSKGRASAVKEKLLDLGFTSDDIATIHAPIGLSIGAMTPFEIAVSIMAEIIEIKNRASAGEKLDMKLLHSLTHDSHKDRILATIVGRHGSAPRGIGAKMLITADGTVGTIGGGCMEAGVVSAARRMLLSDKPVTSIVNVDLSVDDAEDEGMVCGGILDILLERFPAHAQDDLF